VEPSAFGLHNGGKFPLFLFFTSAAAGISISAAGSNSATAAAVFFVISIIITTSIVLIIINNNNNNNDDNNNCKASENYYYDYYDYDYDYFNVTCLGLDRNGCSALSKHFTSPRADEVIKDDVDSAGRERGESSIRGSARMQ